MPTNSNIEKATDILRKGGLVAFPTETVYGLGADATNESAIRKIFQVKERPFNHPLIVHIATIEQMAVWGANISSQAIQLAKVFWPGPLTLILKKQPKVLDILTGWQNTIGLRMPHHPIATALLRAFDGGIAAPSANKFTHISPTTAKDVYQELGESVDLILDGGECEVGLESTIVDMSTDTPMILRPGMISADMISEVLGARVSSLRQDIPVTRAPGMHHLHYAPTTKTILLKTNKIASKLEKLKETKKNVVFIVHSEQVLSMLQNMQIVKMPDEPSGYAHRLYHTLRSLDNQAYQQIIIEDVPDTPDWEAIRDRLVKASGKRHVEEKS